METVNHNTEVKGKYEVEIKQLSAQVKELGETIFELENQLKDEQ